jgi:phosphatidylglycerol:prolipoprotein diacylglycerol transferase
MHPILFKIGEIKIFTYGFMLALAFLSAIYLAGREARRTGLPVARFYDLCFYSIIAAIVGSRLLYVLLEYPYFLSHPLEVFVLWRGGLVFHGGLVLAVGVAVYYAYRHGLSWKPTLDAIVVGMPMGQFFGRIGCFMAGCCYGKPTHLPWAVTFADPETLCPIHEPLHPTQLYEALLALGVFGVVYFFRTRKHYDGQLALMYLCLAGWVRFTVEFFRSPEDYRGPVLFGNMPLTQVVALGLALVSGAWLAWLWWRRRQPAVSVPSPK